MKGQFTWVHPRIPGLRDVFYTIRHRTRPDKEHGYSLQPRIVHLVKPATALRGEKSWKCQAGLEPLVEQWLTEHGYQVRKTGERLRRLPPPDLDAMEGQELYDELLLKTIRKHDHPMFRHQLGQADLNCLIGKVALAWPKKRILVLATRVKDCRRLGKYLKRLGLKVTLHTGRDHPQRAGRIVVATSTCWNEGSVGIRHRQILIALNPDELLRKTLGQIAIEQAERARVYGFLPVSSKLAPYDRDMVTAVFGPGEVHIEREQSEQPVRVVFTRWTGHLFSDSELDAFAVKKQGIWRQGPRNRHIATLATVLAQQDEDMPRRQFPALSEAVQGRMPGRVGVLVENVEHAMELAKVLPGGGSDQRP